MRKYFHSLISLFLVACIGLSAGSLQAQDIDKAVSLYEKGQYEEALSLFKQSSGPQAILFAGKCYYSLGRMLEAQTHLNRVPEKPVDIHLEAEYTSALVEFQLKQFGNALNRLYKLTQHTPRTPIVNDAVTFYKQILNYLTLSQRKNAYQQARDIRVKIHIIKSAFGKVDYSTAKLLYKELVKTLPDDSLRHEIDDMRKVISDSLNYAYQMAFGDPLQAPDGLIYNIGVALPAFDNDSPQYNISRGLYNGYLLAAEEFNRNNTDVKAFLRYKNTDEDSAGTIMTDFAWNYQIDVLLGPLFSEPARRMANMAEQYQIPLLAPLANSDSLNLDNPFVYQANPTFGSHGRRMAEFAVNNLEMDTLAVLAERNSLGAASAYAFRREAERLGAKIAHFYVEDLEQKGYEIIKYTKKFTTDSTTLDSLNLPLVDGVYAPFTGQVAPTLIDLLLTDLEAMNSEVTVFGSQEWGEEWDAAGIPEERLKNRSIYFTESYYLNRKSDRVDTFRERYKKRFGIDSNRFSMIGYDSAVFLLRTLENTINPALLKNAIKTQPPYEGLISNIYFDGRHVNQRVKVFRISDQGIKPAVY